MLKKKLNNQTEIPMLGLGVFRTPDGDENARAVSWAIEAGYRHVDTASVYGNEKSTGRGIHESGVNRNELFITTKLWNDDMRNHVQKEAFYRSLEKLGLDYIDLYLIHWPVMETLEESWGVLEELYSEKLIRAIGVSNFHKNHLQELFKFAKVMPAINQIERHPRLTQMPLIEYCRTKNIAVEAWSPLGGDSSDILTNQTIINIGKKYNKSAAQTVIRWDLQSDVVVIPKSVHKERIKANIDVFDFELSDEDMKTIDRLNQNHRFSADPDNFDF
ncbi:MAG: aldo/keto reductase [Bacillota bacterium]|nr:aldo/keto reductase [Bacillota bacterium]